MFPKKTDKPKDNKLTHNDKTTATIRIVFRVESFIFSPFFSETIIAIKNKKNEVLEMEFNYKMIGISLILLSTIVKVEGILSPIEILDRNQFRCGRQQSKELCSKSAIERKTKLKILRISILKKLFHL